MKNNIYCKCSDTKVIPLLRRHVVALINTSGFENGNGTRLETTQIPKEPTIGDLFDQEAFPRTYMLSVQTTLLEW
jgi:hypothetical protein